MSSFTTSNKSSASSYNTPTKSVGSFTTELRHGKTGTFDQIGDRPMDDPSVHQEQTLSDQTFDQLSDQPWQTQTKN